MSSVRSAETNDVELLPVPVVAERLGLPVTKVHQLLRDGVLVAVRGGPSATSGETSDRSAKQIPAGLIGVDSDGNPAPVKGVAGVITLLRDAHFDDDEIVEWLHRPDDSLPGRPVDALRENRGTEVKRRAQAAGF